MSRSSQWSQEIREQDELAESFLLYQEWLHFLGVASERPPSDGDEQPERSADSEHKPGDIAHNPAERQNHNENR